MNQEIEIKHEVTRRMLDAKKLSGLLLSRQTSFQWFTGGRMNDVIKNEDSSLVYLFITKDKRYLIASRSDADRVMTEELDSLGFEPLLYNWYDQSVFDAAKKIISLNQVGSDFNNADVINLEQEVAHLRIKMTVFEIERFKKLCLEYSHLLTDFCMNLKPGVSEKNIASRLNCECSKKGIRTPVLMIGSDERIYKYRHPAATDKIITSYVLIATVVEREGICANISRSLYFGKVPGELKLKQEAVNEVIAKYYSYSGPGVTLGELFEMGKKAYAGAGYPDEWENHLQGGISGYKPLEFLILPGSNITINNNNILGLNPTIKGAKAEDPALIQDGEAFQFSIDKRWPYKEIKIEDKKYLRPDILEIG